MKEFNKELKNKVDIFENELNKCLSLLALDVKDQLYSSMKYSLTAGGKRIRPVLLMATAEMFKIEYKEIMPLCLAVELIHTYSLIHDDLPAMDNDDLRRGKPTNHKVYGEAIAILAGDALLNLAYEVCFKKLQETFSENYLTACSIIAECAGSRGMIAGQALDIAAEKLSDRTLEEVQILQLNKTAKMICASVLPAAVIAKVSDAEFEKLSDFSINLGLAFQTVDDILDFEGNTETLGKKVNKDDIAKKLTSLSVAGLEESKKLAEKYTNDALAALKIFGEKAEFLRQLTEMMLKRNK